MSLETLLARPSRVIHLIAVLLIGALGACVAWAALTPVQSVVRVPGRLRAQAEVPVRLPEDSLIGTRVVEVLFQPGRPVVEGEPLFRLDADALQARVRDGLEKIQALERKEAEQQALIDALPQKHAEALQRAQNETANAKVELEEQEQSRETTLNYLKERLRAAEVEEERIRAAPLAFTRDAMSKAQQNTRRIQTLVQLYEKPASKALLNDREAGLKLLRSMHQAERHVEELRQLDLRGQMRRQRDEVEALRKLEAQATVKAIVGGHVLGGELRPGSVLERGKPALFLVEQAVEFEMLVPAEELGRFALGAEVEVRLEGQPPLRGKVKSIAPDALEGRDGDRTGRSLYPVRLTLPGEAQATLRPGLGGVGEVEVGRQTLLQALLHDVHHAVRFD